MTATQQPHHLRTEYAENPLGIDETSPDLRWRVDSDRRGVRQTAFRVLVASTPEQLAANEGDIWDTGRRSSSRPAVVYDGSVLEAGETYHWKVRVWDESDDESKWSAPARWGMGLLDATDWEASWVCRAEDDTFERGQFTYFRRSFDLADDVARARAYVSASHQYALSINGETINRGPSFSYPDYQYYKTIDVSATLDAGENVIGALQTWNGEGQGRPAAEPGFILQLVVEYENGREHTVVTDDSWQVREGPWLDAPMRNGEINEPVEIIDGRRVPHGWNEPGFDDEGWDDAAVVGTHPTSPWERLVAQVREVVRSPVDPESIDRLDSGAYVVDFGRVYAGVPVIRFACGAAGRRVEMRAGYRLDADGTVSEQEGTQWTDMRYAYVQCDGEQEFRPFNYLGFRYLQIDSPGEELAPDQVTLVASRNGVPDEQAATFESAEGSIDDVFELARHSALYGCQEQFIDTPTREKGQFLVDSLNISRTTTHAFRERTLTRQAISEFVRSHYRYWATEGRLNAVYPNGDGKRDIPEFTVLFPEWVWRYYRTAGDTNVLERVYPVVRAVADYVVRHVDSETGLVMNLSGGNGGPYEEGIIDWPPEMRYGYDRDWPARTTVNILSANVLRRAATIAAELDRPAAEQAYYREHQSSIETAINTRLTDGDLYIDGCDAESASEHASQHANALALAFGVVPVAAVDTVADHTVECGMQMGPMMVPWLLEALEVTERPTAMVDLLTDQSHDGWADILRMDGTFTWETWKARDPDLPDDQRRNRSESHAMGATVLVAIQRTLLGVRPQESGNHIQIKPPADGLVSATGRIPTERGPVTLSWRRDESAFHLDVTVPWNASATVSLPATGDDNSVTENGDPVWSQRNTPTLSRGVTTVQRTDEAVVIDIEAGTYQFVVE